MKIENTLSPSFKALLINNKTQVFNNSIKENEYVSCIKIDPKNSGDIKALDKITKFWTNSKFTTNIYHAACALRNESKYYINNKIFLLTKQNSDFEKLDYSKVLGMTHVSLLQDNSVFIEHLEANPEIIYSSNREYSGIGSAILDYLKTITDKLSCFPSNTDTVKNFYYKNDFKEVLPGSNLFVWKKKTK